MLFPNAINFPRRGRTTPSLSPKYGRWAERHVFTLCVNSWGRALMYKMFSFVISRQIDFPSAF